MSDEESFVILGSSPMSSLENDGVETRKSSIDSSLECDTPGSRFTSLKNSQINELKSAQESAAQKQNHLQIQEEMAEPVMVKSMKAQNSLIELTDPGKKSLEMQENLDKEQDIAASKLWSRAPQVQVEEKMIPLSLEDCALKSPVEQKLQQNPQEEAQAQSPKSNEELQTNKTTPSQSVDTNLAASFIMGEINSDVLKTSVYSQFPSISLEACAEDVVKLQNMVTEYSQLKSTIKRANNTMKVFYQNSLQWKEKMQSMEENYKQQLDKCKKEIEELRKQNDGMERNFQTQFEALEIARNKDREEYIQAISEKSALLENMRVQIIKLEQQQMSSFDIVLSEKDQQKNESIYMTHLEHELKIKNLQRQLSELMASNLDFKDVEKQYVDELNCLKVNLTAAEELMAKNRSEIIQLTSLNAEKEQQIKTLEASFKTLQIAFEEQKERISLLETQNEVHRTDFEMEKQSRETAVKEKQQILQDLRSLQKRNQELIEEQQKIADSFQKRISLNAGNNDAQLNAASAAAQTYFNNPQRPIRVLPSTSSSPATSPPVALHMCPVCNKGFKSLNILLSHVNDCVDKN